jgi:Ca2+-binding EF-hand superfamily protein
VEAQSLFFLVLRDTLSRPIQLSGLGSKSIFKGMFSSKSKTKEKAEKKAALFAALASSNEDLLRADMASNAEGERLRAEEAARLKAEREARETRLLSEEATHSKAEKDAEETRLQAEKAVCLNAERDAEDERLRTKEVARMEAEQEAEAERLRAEKVDRLKAEAEEDEMTRWRRQYGVAAKAAHQPYLGMPQFVALVNEAQKGSSSTAGTSDTDLRKAFELADVDRSGLLDEEEFVQVMELIKEGNVTGLGNPLNPLNWGKEEAFRKSIKGAAVSAETAPVPTEDEVTRWRRQYDAASIAARKPYLGKLEFLELVKKILTGLSSMAIPTDMDLNKAFVLADVDESGLVDKEEFVQIMKLIKQGKVNGLGNPLNPLNWGKEGEFRKSIDGSSASLHSGSAYDTTLNADEEARWRKQFDFAAEMTMSQDLEKPVFVALATEVLNSFPTSAVVLPSHSDLDAAFVIADVDKSGKVDKEEFVLLMRLVKKGKVTGLGGGLSILNPANWSKKVDFQAALSSKGV